ncbi:DNA-binding response regulator [Maribellus luteus]|uniref:DNA-binding response regulator n=2 Tax=Maribellus luteus TaxID=2305463 RepID=A0A399SWD1_9BACT|nr:DNA-binding response regulator [Maribellus luteus]
MATSFALILYQNMLFGEGLESILVRHDFSVRKYPISQSNKDLISTHPNPDILILEFNWPCQNLDQFIRNNEMIHDSSIKTLLVTNMVNKYILRLIRHEKIQGIVLKCSDAEELIFALKQVADDKKYYSSLVANLIFNDSSDMEEVRISKREKQILTLLAEMKTTSEIADDLSISPSTVKTHRRNLLQKFKAKSLLCLLRLACRQNLLSEETDYCGCCYKKFIGQLN